MTGLFSGWFLVTIVTPVVSPVLALLVFRFLPIPGPPINIMTLVKDGQLGWVVIAMGASAIYELWGGMETCKLPGEPGWALGGLIVVMAVAVLAATGGAASDTRLLTNAGGGAMAWVAHYRLFVGSAVLVVVAAILYTYVHFYIQFSTSPCLLPI